MKKYCQKNEKIRSVPFREKDRPQIRNITKILQKYYFSVTKNKNIDFI